MTKVNLGGRSRKLADRKEENQQDSHGKAPAPFRVGQSEADLRERAKESLEKAEKVLAESGDQFLKNKKKGNPSPDKTGSLRKDL